MAPAFQAQPLALYVPRMSSMYATRRVREVDTVTYGGSLGWHDSLRPKSPGAPFRPVQRLTVQRMTVVRFRAPHPTPVEPLRLTTAGANATRPFIQGD
jgi:hypothetical protein